jgi:deoxyribodipyrimidine photolyase-like uncharacterized protein
MAFDTLSYAKKLQEGGFTVQQAEAQTEALRMVFEQELATKQDIELLRHELREMEARLEARMAELEARLGASMAQLEARMAERETRLLVRLGAITIGAVTILGVFLGALIALGQ